MKDDTIYRLPKEKPETSLINVFKDCNFFSLCYKSVSWPWKEWAQRTKISHIISWDWPKNKRAELQPIPNAKKHVQRPIIWSFVQVLVINNESSFIWKADLNFSSNSICSAISVHKWWLLTFRLLNKVPKLDKVGYKSNHSSAGGFSILGVEQNPKAFSI